MVDIHAHALFGIDDGAGNLQMSLDLLRAAQNEGVRDLICTSHSYGQLQDYEKNFKTLQQSVRNAGIDICLYRGCEIQCDIWDIDEVVYDLNHQLLPTINRTPYALIEFDPHASAEGILYCARRLLKGTKNRFIIAHIERYLNLQDRMRIIDQLLDLECLLQINAYSLVEEERQPTKEFARQLLKEQKVSFLGSDCHRTNHRPPIVQSGLQYIHEHCDEAYANSVCTENAQKLLLCKEY